MPTYTQLPYRCYASCSLLGTQIGIGLPNTGDWYVPAFHYTPPGPGFPNPCLFSPAPAPYISPCTGPPWCTFGASIYYDFVHFNWWQELYIAVHGVPFPYGAAACYANEVWEPPLATWGTAHCFLTSHTAPFVETGDAGWLLGATRPKEYHCYGDPNTVPCPAVSGDVSKFFTYGCAEEKPAFESGAYKCWCCTKSIFIDGANRTFTFDRASNICIAGDPCPDASRWCEALHMCIELPPPACAEQRHCEWDPTTCSWDCLPLDDICGPTQHFDEATCTCVDCPPGKCWCRGRQECVDCPPPKCAEELGCEWDTSECRWVCDDIFGFCPAGTTWYFSETDCCGCYPNCPPGQCWCANYDYPGCVDCSEPTCKERRDCFWDPCTCAWDCAITEEELEDCPDGYTFNPETCQCESSGTGPTNEVIIPGQYCQAYIGSTGIHFQLSHTPRPPRAGTADTWYTDVDATSDPLDSSPCLLSDPVDEEWIHLFFHRHTPASGPTPAKDRILWTASCDDGKTWLEEAPLVPVPGRKYIVKLFDDCDICAANKNSVGEVLILAMGADGQLKGRFKAAHAQTFDVEFTCQVADLSGGPPGTLSDFALDHKGIAVVMMLEDEERWMLFAVLGGNLYNWNSADNGQTWRPA